MDWWALGVLMFEMMAGRSPFDIVGSSDNPDQNTEDYLFQGELPEFWIGFVSISNLGVEMEWKNFAFQQISDSHFASHLPNVHSRKAWG